MELVYLLVGAVCGALVYNWGHRQGKREAEKDAAAPLHLSDPYLMPEREMLHVFTPSAKDPERCAVCDRLETDSINHIQPVPR